MFLVADLVADPHSFGWDDGRRAADWGPLTVDANDPRARRSAGAWLASFDASAPEHPPNQVELTANAVDDVDDARAIRFDQLLELDCHTFECQEAVRARQGSRGRQGSPACEVSGGTTTVSRIC